jgi:hypothetical protein
MKYYSRAYVSEFQAGAQSIVDAAKLDINNSNNSANANTNIFFATTTALDTIVHYPAKAWATIKTLDTIAFRPTMASATITASESITFCPATASTAMASATTTASDCVAVCPATKASDCIAVLPKMDAVVARSAEANTATNTTSSDCFDVRSHKTMIVSASKTDTKAGLAVNEWVIFYISDVPMKFVIVDYPLYACTCKG